MCPGSAAEALEMLMAAMRYLAAADATAMASEEQARCLRVLEQATAVGTAARTSVLSAFTAGQGYSADADYSPRAWLIHKTGVTKATAVAYTAWTRRAAEHPRVVAALATGELSESYGRTICRGPASSPGTAARPPTRSCCPPPRRAWTCGIWPGWPPRSTSGPGLSCPMRTPPGRSKTARCGW